MESCGCAIKYSVVIPVYNAETTVRRCLDSLTSQLRNDVELLVMNDGSTDGGGLICREYAEKYSNVRYFEQPNRGVSAARNACLDAVTGEYVLFVDSDDFVAEGYFDTLDRQVNGAKADMVQFGSCVYPMSTIRTPETYFLADEISVAEKIGQLLRGQQLYALWDKVFKNSIIQDNGIRFTPGLSIGEDVAFVLSYVMHVHSLASISEALYYQDVSGMESLSRKRRDYLFEQLQKVNAVSFETVRRADREELFKVPLLRSITYQSYRSVYSASKELLKYDLSPQKRRGKIRVICESFCKEAPCPMDWKCRVIALPVRLRLTRVIDLLIRKKK